jgi:hypothetical protein
VSPAIAILMLTLLVSFATGHPQDLFLAGSTMDVAVRFTYVTVALLVPLAIMPWTLTLASLGAKRFGQLVKVLVSVEMELSKSDAWIFRPIQGIALSMIFAERFLSLLEFSTGASSSQTLVQFTFFITGGILTSLFLSAVWSLDDLGVKVYDHKTSQVRTAGGSIGTILPLVTGIIGISTLFHFDSPVHALIQLLQIVIVLYPSYVIFVTVHNEFLKRRIGLVSRRSNLKLIEINVMP